MAILQYVVLEIDSQFYNVLKIQIHYQEAVRIGVYIHYNTKLVIFNNN